MWISQEASVTTCAPFADKIRLIRINSSSDLVPDKHYFDPANLFHRVKAIGAANTLAAGATEGEGGVKCFQVFQSIQNHALSVT